jgi:hypothetical protein
MWRLPCRAPYNRFRPAGKDAHGTLEGTVGTSPRSNQRQPPAPSIPSTPLRLVILFEVGRAFSGQGRSRSDLVWLMVFHDDLAMIGGLMRANMSIPATTTTRYSAAVAHWTSGRSYVASESEPGERDHGPMYDTLDALVRFWITVVLRAPDSASLLPVPGR